MSGKYWYDPETKRYYRWDREHREQARQASIAKRARLSVEPSVGAAGGPLRENIASNLLESQLCPSSFMERLHLSALAAWLRTPGEKMGVIPDERHLYLRSFNSPLISLHPSLPVAVYCFKHERRSITVVRDYEVGLDTLMLTQMSFDHPTDVLELSPEVRGLDDPVVFAIVDDKRHSTLVVEGHKYRHDLPSVPRRDDDIVRSRCLYDARQIFFDAQWYPRGSQFVALGGNSGRACLLNVERGEMSLICSPFRCRNPARAAKIKSPVTSVCWACGCSSDAAFSLFCGRRNGSLHRCDIRQPAHANSTMDTLADLKSVVTSIQPLSCMDDTMFVAGSVDGRVALYDTRSTRPGPLVQYTKPVSDGTYRPPSFALSCGDTLLTAFCPDNSVRCWTAFGSCKQVAMLLPPSSGEKHAIVKVLCDRIIACCFDNGESFMWTVPPSV